MYTHPIVSIGLKNMLAHFILLSYQKYTRGA